MYDWSKSQVSTLAFDVNGQKCGNRQGTFLKKENQMHVFIPDLLDQMGREVTILVDHFLFKGSCSFIHLWAIEGGKNLMKEE